MRNSHSHRVIEITAALLIILFFYTGVNKILLHTNFRAVMARSPLIGSNAKMLSWIIPFAELFTCVLLFIPVTRKWGLILSFSLMILFTAYISYMILTASRLPCSCGGVLKQMTWGQHLLFNLCFCTLAGYSLWIYKPKRFIAINRNSRIPV